MSEVYLYYYPDYDVKDTIKINNYSGSAVNCYLIKQSSNRYSKANTSIKESGYSFIQVKTVQMGKYEEYDHTNQFYISLGFKEFEVFPTLWDEWNPCQVYVMAV